MSAGLDNNANQTIAMVKDAATQAVFSIDPGRSLNLSMIAEGVETAEQEYYLSQRGCQLAQGYYFFSKPLLPKDFETFVKGFHRQIVENNA